MTALQAGPQRFKSAQRWSGSTAPWGTAWVANCRTCYIDMGAKLLTVNKSKQTVTHTQSRTVSEGFYIRDGDSRPRVRPGTFLVFSMF